MTCKSEILFVEKEYHISNERGKLPYKISKNSNNKGKAALVIPDNPDSLKLFQSELIKRLYKMDYQIIFPGKAGATDPYLWRLLDTKSDRTNDLISLIISLLDNTIIGTSSFIIIGFGEGAYLSLAVSNILKPDYTFLVNAGPYSSLTEIDLIVENGEFTEKQKKLLSYLNVSSLKILKERLENIRYSPNEENNLSNGSNKYYRSYDNSMLINDFLANRNQVIWIISGEYPLITKESKSVIQQLLKARTKQKGSYYTIEGEGNFNKKAEDIALTEKILEVLIPPR